MNEINKDNVWFCGDTHFGHANIIKFCDRPFSTANEMDEALIANWNDLIGKDDHVFHVGDFSFHTADKTIEILKRLNGHKYLIIGNHEKVVLSNDSVKKQFVWIRPAYDLRIDNDTICMYHYAQRVWNKSHNGSFHLYGHSHGTLEKIPYGKSMDVGVDCNNYFPFPFSMVKSILDERPMHENIKK